MDTTRLAPQTFEQSLFVQLRSVEGGTTPVAARMSYDSSDPYAVTISFYIEETSIPWTFARDLISGGLTEPTGDGDVHVWPCLDEQGFAVAAIELCSPQGDALVEMRTKDAVAFLERTRAIVEPGMESAHLDVDALITAIRAAGIA